MDEHGNLNIQEISYEKAREMADSTAEENPLLSISGFFHSNQPDGLEIFLHDHPHQLAFFALVIDKRANDLATSFSVKKNIRDLKSYIPFKKYLSLDQKLWCLGFIQALEQGGELEPDNYNGMIYEYAVEGTLH